jgi:outer membrane lipoprotein-sorting protein
MRAAASRRRGLAAVAVWAAVTAACAVPPPAGAAEEAAARRLLGPVEQRFDSVRSLQYSARRESVSGGRTVEESWSLRYRAPDAVRVEHTAGYTRLLVGNTEALWEYVPEARRAVRTDLAGLAPGARAQAVAAVLARVAVDGVRVGDLERFVTHAANVEPSSEQPEVWIIRGADPAFRLAVDTNRQVLVSTELFDPDGRLKLRTTASAFCEAAPGFWYPGRVRVESAADDGSIVSTITLSDIRVNAAIPDAVFAFTPPRGTEILSP